MKKNQKVGIVTLFNSHNYGAVLQAYATYEYVKKIGYNNVEFVNYENEFEKTSKNTLKFIFKGNIKSIIKKIIQYIIFRKNKNLKKAFSKFNNSLIKSKKYTEKEILSVNEYDILISGSDQIWNPVIFKTLDKTYLLDFNNKAKKISISSSAGSYKFNKDELNIISKLLNNYQAISVREKSLKEQLQPAINKEIFVSVDPTLLLNNKEWSNILKAKNTFDEESNEYILVYIVDANYKDYQKEIEILKSRLNKKIWMITPYKFKMKNIDKNIVGATPNDFINLIKNANCIITNSFHGVIFSNNFNKTFFALENHKNPQRVYDFLNSINLTKRIIKNTKDAKNIDLTYDNKNASIKLNELIENTKKWINKNL